MPTPTLPPIPEGFTLENSAGKLPPLPPGFALVEEAKKRGMDIFPNWLQDAAKYGPGFLQETGTVAKKAWLTGLANMGEAAGHIAGEGMRDPNIGPGPKPQEEIAKIPDEMPNGYYRRMIEGGAGAMTLPLPGMGLGAQLMTGMASGLGGQAGRQVGEKFSPGSPKIQDWADTAGSLGAGAITGFAAGPKQSVARADVRKVLEGQDFGAAMRNAEAAQKAGSTTATAAEMFPVGSSVMRLAERARAATPVNPLAAATENRPGDIKALADEFLNRIRPSPVDSNIIANSAADSAGGVIQSAKNQRNTAIGNRLSVIPPIPPHDVRDIVDYLTREANTPGITPSRQAAYREAASKFTDAQGNLLTNPQDISLRLVEMQNAPKNPNFTGFQGQTVATHDVQEALKNARDAVTAFRPAFGQALDDFAAFSRGPIADLKAGPFGSMADKNPLTAGQTPVSRLEGMLSGNSPQTVGGTARVLADPVMTNGNKTSATDIARALAQRKLNLGPTDPGAAVRGTEGSNAQNQFESLLRAGGNDARNTMEPLAVADRLQPFLKSAGNSEPPKMQGLQYLLRPFRSIDMATTGQSMNSVNKEVAQLLADGSPASIKRLQEISMFDPNVRKMLMLKSAIPTGNQEN